MRGVAVRALLSAGSCVALTACGIDSEPPALHPPTQPSPVDACLAFSPTVTPITGSGPLHRTNPITARWAGGVVDVDFSATVDGVEVRHVLHVDDGVAFLIPERVWPQDARVEWTFAACGVKKTGHFNTGALMAPVDIDDVVGRSYGFDLRTVAWEQPAASTTANGFVLRWHLAPSFVVDVVDADLGHATLAIAPGVVDDDGRVVRDLNAGHTVLSTSLLGNPYLYASAPELSLMALDGEVILKELDLVLGLGDGCFTDSRLVAVMDVRHLEKAGKAPCARLMSLTGESCVPCDDGDDEGDGDGEAGCFLLALDGLASVSDVDSTVPAPAPAPLP
jgi:hypothetical protein